MKAPDSIVKLLLLNKYDYQLSYFNSSIKITK